MKKQLFFLVGLLCFVGVIAQAQQRRVLVEQFTSSTCYPYCPQMNAWLNPMLVTNADKVAVVKYQMNWPGAGDKYYTPEGGTRRAFYNVNGVPMLYANGVNINSQSALQTAIDNGYAQPAQATITGGFLVVGDMIYVEANVTPLITGTNYFIHVVVCEKVTTGNKGSNGETEFHHVMMKMFPNGSGTTMDLTEGVTIPLQFSHDMSTTHVEEMDDLEVIVFIQNKSTKAVLNAGYALENNMTLPLPPANFTATQQDETLNINLSWTAVSGASGYDVYKEGVKLNTNPVTGTTYQDVAAEYGKTYTYGVEAIVGGVTSFRAVDKVFTNLTLPVPTLTTVKQIRGLDMLVEWTIPPGFEQPIKYYVYRSGNMQTPPGLTSDTSIINKGITYKEYIFQIEPIFNEIIGTKSEGVSITLINIPQPKNLNAEQVSQISKEVLLTWDASTTNTAGYNLYRDDVLINEEMITATTYTDVVPQFGVEYTYQLYGVAETGAESEKNRTAKITLTSSIPPPANVQATQQGDELKVAVSWDAIAVKGIDGYNVYRDGEQVNATLVEGIEYLDEVPKDGKYCYTVAAVVDDVEGTASEPACVDITLVGICHIDKETLFAIYPNPVSGTLNVNSKETISDCQIFNIQGQLIYSTQSDVKEIATDNWASGVYIIRITTEKGSAEKRFIKK